MLGANNQGLFLSYIVIDYPDTPSIYDHRLSAPGLLVALFAFQFAL